MFVGVGCCTTCHASWRGRSIAVTTEVGQAWTMYRHLRGKRCIIVRPYSGMWISQTDINLGCPHPRWRFHENERPCPNTSTLSLLSIPSLELPGKLACPGVATTLSRKGCARSRGGEGGGGGGGRASADLRWAPLPRDNHASISFTITVKFRPTNVPWRCYSVGDIAMREVGKSESDGYSIP